MSAAGRAGGHRPTARTIVTGGVGATVHATTTNMLLVHGGAPHAHSTPAAMSTAGVLRVGSGHRAVVPMGEVGQSEVVELGGNGRGT